MARQIGASGGGPRRTGRAEVDAAGRGGGSGGADGLGEAVMASTGSSLFYFFCSINRGGHATAFENASFIEVFAQRRLPLPASENISQPPQKQLLQ
jgi:hypothetical protein